MKPHAFDKFIDLCSHTHPKRSQCDSYNFLRGKIERRFFHLAYNRLKRRIPLIGMNNSPHDNADFIFIF